MKTKKLIYNMIILWKKYFSSFWNFSGAYMNTLNFQKKLIARAIF